MNCRKLEAGDDVRGEITAIVFQKEPPREVIVVVFFHKKKTPFNILFLRKTFTPDVLSRQCGFFFLGAN